IHDPRTRCFLVNDHDPPLLFFLTVFLNNFLSMFLHNLFLFFLFIRNFLPAFFLCFHSLFLLFLFFHNFLTFSRFILHTPNY
ncbi:unnamed protein product, partial [Brassica rapa subsp. narinosa]